MVSRETYPAIYLSALLEKHGDKPVYAYCGYNYYKLIRVIDVGEYIILESPETDGCWMPADSIGLTNDKEEV
jgi:hypothetical protein